MARFSGEKAGVSAQRLARVPAVERRAPRETRFTTRNNELQTLSTALSTPFCHGGHFGFWIILIIILKE